MIQKITESQLRKIIAESARKILNEYKRSPQIDNPGGVARDEVRWKGYRAQFNVPGRYWGDSYDHHNDSSVDVIKKHSGGLNAKADLAQLLIRAVDYKDEMASKEFMRALSHIPQLYNTIFDATIKYVSREDE